MTVGTYTAPVPYHAPLVPDKGHTSEEPCYAHGVRRRSTPPPPDPEPVPWPEVDVNQVVAYNVRQARELRGWTQEELADRLEPYLGQRLTQAAVSSIERAWDGERRREFDAHELLIFALVFDLPITWFFLPPAGDRRMMRATTRPVDELYARLLGLPHQLSRSSTPGSASTGLLIPPPPKRWWNASPGDRARLAAAATSTGARR